LEIALRNLIDRSRKIRFLKEANKDLTASLKMSSDALKVLFF
jgi:hypothetical protein